jgi:hypothetical protein
MSKIWVDPPLGWKYGFPRIWDNEKDGSMRDWMIKCGYPQQEIDSCGEHFYTRQWEAEDAES